MTALIRLNGICKSYPQGQHRLEVLKGIDLTVNTGEFVALCGPSGSGKSTLLNIVGLLDAPDAGNYTWQQHSVDLHGNARIRTIMRRQRLGFVFQAFNLVPVMSAAENIEYPLLLTNMSSKEREDAVGRMLDQVGLTEFADQLPDQLSGGQRQRIAIARALVNKPALVIADEPTANLDSATAYQIIGLMRQLARETATAFLIATHDERMTDQCDRIIYLCDGQILPQVAGKPAPTKQNKEVVS